MFDATQILSGEYSRRLDDRYRLTLPGEFEKLFKPNEGKCVIAKEQSGCISLWDAEQWKIEYDNRVAAIFTRLKAGSLNQQKVELQKFGRLLATRHREVQLAERGRLVLPEGFREFLAVEKGKEVMVVGAISCIELWKPERWFEYVETNITEFGTLLNTLS
ncbi:MAG: division/cell wall cluster transcriptional repressor MraZ [Planctomycetaceae bacterium]|nr:division/cell wall cluster transcriptional repressor MraZ [Planctomycetaceae bacterium]